MLDSAAPPHTDLATQLPADAYAQLIRTLRLALPPPLTDSPEDLARRDHSAIARIAALLPANAAEADLAALFVAGIEQWKECLRLAQLPDISAGWAMKCRAQANSMVRQAQSALRLLLRLQAAREKREANSAASDRAAWTEHCATGLMTQALPPQPEEAARSPGSLREPTPDQVMLPDSDLAEFETEAQPEIHPVSHTAKRDRHETNADPSISVRPRLTPVYPRDSVAKAGIQGSDRFRVRPASPLSRGSERDGAWELTRLPLSAGHGGTEALPANSAACVGEIA